LRVPATTGRNAVEAPTELRRRRRRKGPGSSKSASTSTSAEAGADPIAASSPREADLELRGLFSSDEDESGTDSEEAEGGLASASTSPAADEELGDEGHEKEKGRVLKIWAFTSDHGSDCAAARSRIIAEIDRRPDEVLGVEIDCLLHQFHLICCHHLHLADDYIMPSVGLAKLRYYASLAKLIHLWREHSSKVMKIWEKKWGITDAWKSCRHVVPAPIAGRWGRASAVEKHILERDVQNVLWCLRKLCEEVAESRGAKSKADEKKEKAAALDEIRVEEMQEYAKRLGRWARDCLKVLEHPERFATALRIAQATRADLDHLMFFIEGRREFCLAELVWSKGREIAADVHELVNKGIAALLGVTLPACVSERRVREAVAAVSVRISANFDRRILGRLESFPARLLWLARGQAAEKEPMRAVVAQELLNLVPGSGNVSCMKIARLFRDELEECIRTGGELRATLLAPVVMLAERWRPDS
jgi:hypothetical protein